MQLVAQATEAADCPSSINVLVQNLAAILAALGALVAAWKAKNRAGEAARAVNGRMEQMLAARAQAAHDRGYARGVLAQKPDGPPPDEPPRRRPARDGD